MSRKTTKLTQLAAAQQSAPATPDPTVAVEPEKPEPPEWALKTPEECSYQLTMYETYGSEAQSVNLTRSEFIYLKCALANLREVDYDLPGAES